MFTRVDEEVTNLETFWAEEEDLDILRARLTIRLDGLKARYQQGRPGFTGTNIRRIEALFEGLKLLDGLERHLVKLDQVETHQAKRLLQDGLRLTRLIGATNVSERAAKRFRAKLQETRTSSELGWHPHQSVLCGMSSLSMASATC